MNYGKKFFFSTLGGIFSKFSTLYNGTTQRTQAPFDANYALRSANDFTVSFWFKGTTATGFILGDFEYSSGVKVELFGGNVRFWLGGFAVDSSGVTVTDGNWHHVACLHGAGSPENIEIYIDGVQRATTSAFLGYGNSTKGITFGIPQAWNVGTGIGIQLDEITRWDRFFSAADITELYNGGKPIDPNKHTRAATLLINMRMGDGDTTSNIINKVDSVNFPNTAFTGASFVEDTP